MHVHVKGQFPWKNQLSQETLLLFLGSKQFHVYYFCLFRVGEGIFPPPHVCISQTKLAAQSRIPSSPQFVEENSKLETTRTGVLTTAR